MVCDDGWLDGMVGAMGHLLFAESDARREHRAGDLDRGDVHQSDANRQTLWGLAGYSAADAVAKPVQADGRRSPGDFRLPPIDPGDQESRAGSNAARRQIGVRVNRLERKRYMNPPIEPTHGQNFSLLHAGDWKDLKEHGFAHPLIGKVWGKLFLKERLKLTGME